MSENITRQNAVKLLNTDLEKGLDKETVLKYKEKYGENVLKEKKEKTPLAKFLNQFKDAMVIILLISAAVSFFAAFKGHEKAEFLEPVIILFIVVLNAVLGVLQENKAEKALSALKNLSSPKAKTIRNGRLEVIDSKELVPGDIIIFEAGDFIPADSLLIESQSLKCEESALTGESVPSEKSFDAVVLENAAIGDKANMVFSGTSVAYGRGRAVVLKTGMNTEMGKIAALLESAEEVKTPLQIRLSKLGKFLGITALILCTIIFIIGILSSLPLLEIFMTSVSLAVSAIPEGLPAIVTIVLAMGVQKMVKKNAIIRNLPAVETLGSASVICSDKTGTLTQNKMTVTKVWAENEPEDFNSDSLSRLSNKAKTLIKLAALACDGYVETENNMEKHIGDPTETAIAKASLLLGMEKRKLDEKNRRLFEIPFDSDRKLMTTINEVDGKIMVITKGAPDILLKRCADADISEAEKFNEQMAENALRVLAVGIKEIESLPENVTPDIEYSLKFLGLIGMIDPPRPEAKEAVKMCKSAGIRPVMITGDHAKTACAIAEELGILEKDDLYLTGESLKNISDDELFKNVNKYSVYARVSPEDKIRIVKAWQKRGETVAMTGDGVNDAPALKAADIGCAMGITGTDTAKGASDLTLTDDNFATIVYAVEEGRGIYENIKKAVQFLLGTNSGEIFTVLFAMIFWHKTPLLAIQLLWLNLITDGLPALALGVEPAEENIMLKKPKPKNESIFHGGLGIRIVLQGLMFAVLTLFGFYIGVNETGLDEAGRTMAFIVLSASQLFHVLNIRTSKSFFSGDIVKNKRMLQAVLISFALIGILLFVPPLAYIFKLYSLSLKLYLISIALAFTPVIIIELEKLFFKNA